MAKSKTFSLLAALTNLLSTSYATLAFQILQEIQKTTDHKYYLLNYTSASSESISQEHHLL